MECIQEKTFLLNYVANRSRFNREEFVAALLRCLTPKGITHVQNIASRLKQRKFTDKEKKGIPIIEEWYADIRVGEDGWWEVPQSESVINWAARVGDEGLIAYIKEILGTLRKDELQHVKSSFTKEARDFHLHPDRVLVSRFHPVPSPVGWWSTYTKEEILAVDCEFVPVLIGAKASGKKIYKNSAATISVVDFEENIVYKKKAKYHPTEINITPWMRKNLGFQPNDFIDGTELSIIRDELTTLFQGKLLILVNAGSDFEALKMHRGDFDVFDLHSHYWNEHGEIGLRSIVFHYYGIDIQEIHNSDTDAIYTMKIFREKYIPEKLKNPSTVMSRFSEIPLNDIVKFKK